MTNPPHVHYQTLTFRPEQPLQIVMFCADVHVCDNRGRTIATLNSSSFPAFAVPQDKRRARAHTVISDLNAAWSLTTSDPIRHTPNRPSRGNPPALPHTPEVSPQPPHKAASS